MFFHPRGGCSSAIGSSRSHTVNYTMLGSSGMNLFFLETKLSIASWRGFEGRLLTQLFQCCISYAHLHGTDHLQWYCLVWPLVINAWFPGYFPWPWFVKYHICLQIIVKNAIHKQLWDFTFQINEQALQIT